MQASAVLAAMATLTLVSAASPRVSLSFANPNSYSNPQLHSQFHGLSLKLTRQSLTIATAPKPLTVVAAAKKAVAVLKGNSSVEGVVTLTQEDDG